MTRRRFVQSDNKGFTLVEMLTTLALIGVAAAAVAGFLIVGIRSYTKTHSEAILQKEAQTALNTIESTVIDAALGVNYNVRTSGDQDHFVINDSDSALGGLTVQDKILYIFDWAVGAGGIADYTSIQVTLIRWSPEDECLYYALPQLSLSSSQSVSEAVNLSSVTDWDLFAEGVQEFSCDLSSYETTRKINVSLSMARKNQNYSTNGIILLRNDVLINAQTMEEIYERAEEVLESTITDIEVSANANSIVRSGRIQLTTHVNGTGYPSQSIAKWTVETITNVESVTTDENGVIQITGPTVGEEIYNSASEGSHDWAASVNATTKILTLDENLNHDTLLSSVQYIRVTAYAINPQNPSNLISGARYIAVKSITAFSIQPDKTKFEQNYGTGNTLNNDYKAVSWKNGAQDGSGTMKVNAGYEFTMLGSIAGTNLDSTGENPDTKIVWTIENAQDGVRATVTSQGVVTVNTFSSKGTFDVKATPALNSDMSLVYTVNVVSAYDIDTALTIRGDESMVRDQSKRYYVQLAGNDISDLSEFVFSVEVADQNGIRVSSAPVSVNSDGVVTVTSSLPYDYEYSVTLKAALRSNTNKYATFKIKVPKVTISMNYPIFLISTKGTTINEGKIRCIVTGVQDYALTWSIASNTNSTSFAGSTLNGSYVTYSGKNKADSASIYYSKREPDKACIWVKAALKNHSNIYATSRIMVRYEGGKLTLTSNKDRVLRGENANFTVTNEYKVYNPSEYTWSFDAAYAGSGAQAPVTGLRLENGTLYVDSNYNSTVEDITVTVKVVWAYVDEEDTSGIVTEGEQAVKAVTIPGYKVEVSPKTCSVNRGETVTISSDYDSTWTIESSAYNEGVRFMNGSSKVNSNSYSGRTAVVSVPFEYASSTAGSSKSFKVTASVSSFSGISGGLSSDCTVTVNAVSLSDITTSSSSGTYTFKIKYNNAVPTYNKISWKVTKSNGTEITSGKSISSSNGYSVLTFTPSSSDDGTITITASSSQYTNIATKSVTILNLTNPSSLSNWDTVSYNDWGKTKTTTDLSTGLFDWSHYYRFSRKTTSSVIYLNLQYKKYSQNEDTSSNGYWAYLKENDTWYQWQNNVWVSVPGGPKSVDYSSARVSGGYGNVKQDLLYGTIRW